MAEAHDITRLRERARALGAAAAATLPARAVVVDERVRLKCQVPLCEHYGRNLMCPPHVPAPDEMRAVLARYDRALVVQRAIPLTAAAVADAFGSDGLAAGKAHGEEGQRVGTQSAYERTLRASRNEFAALMTALEADAFGLGCRFAAALSGGDCGLCEVCVCGSGAPCRHPFAARPSMEAVGIDVVATAANAGLAVSFPVVTRAVWTGLLLLD